MEQHPSPKPTRAERAAARRKRAPFLRCFYEKNQTAYAVGVAAMLVSSLLDLGFAYILQQVTDVAVSGTITALGQIGIVTAAFFLLYWAVLLVIRKTKHSFTRRAMVNYKRQAFTRITQKSIGSFAGESTGRYISALTNDAASIEQNYLLASFRLISRVAWFFGALGMMFWYSWELTLAVLALCVLPVSVSMAFGGRLAQQERAVSERNEGFVGMVKDLLSGFAVIKSFKAEREVAQLFGKENADLEEKKYRRRMTEEMITIISAGAGFLVQFGVMLFGAYLCLRGEITVGVVLAFVQLMNYILTPVQDLPTLLANRSAATALIDKLADAVEISTGRAGCDIGKTLRDGIELQDVRYAYEPARPVLSGITHRFAAGRSYAVVGASGSGKTTLLNLLLGSTDTYEGSILFDGTELRKVGSDSLYELISIIQQNVFVFDSTVRENITMFKEFSDARVQSAIDRAGLRQLIETHGADYRCGENGSALSGGEKQRISIARCLLRGTPVLLMDEATAALDAETAFEVTNAVLDVENLTRIVVTHRMDEATLRRFDEILVLRRGVIAECGDFDALMAADGYFHSLFRVAN